MPADLMRPGVISFFEAYSGPSKANSRKIEVPDGSAMFLTLLDFLYLFSTGSLHKQRNGWKYSFSIAFLIANGSKDG
jgi:hypothetical protein